MYMELVLSMCLSGRLEVTGLAFESRDRVTGLRRYYGLEDSCWILVCLKGRTGWFEQVEVFPKYRVTKEGRTERS